LAYRQSLVENIRCVIKNFYLKVTETNEFLCNDLTFDDLEHGAVLFCPFQSITNLEKVCLKILQIFEQDFATFLVP